MKRKILSLFMLMCMLCLLSMARQMTTASKCTVKHCPGESKAIVLPGSGAVQLETSNSISPVHAIVLGI